MGAVSYREKNYARPPRASSRWLTVALVPQHLGRHEEGGADRLALQLAAAVEAAQPEIGQLENGRVGVLRREQEVVGLDIAVQYAHLVAGWGACEGGGRVRPCRDRGAADPTPSSLHMAAITRYMVIRCRQEVRGSRAPLTWWQCSTDLMMPRKRAAARSSPGGAGVRRCRSLSEPPAHISCTRKMCPPDSYTSCARWKKCTK